MIKKRPSCPSRPQQTSHELLTELLSFLERKFYPGHRVEFLKDRSRLLKWVVLWPASWLYNRGVTLPEDRYREIFMSVMMDALRLGDTENIHYLPAYLAKVIQSHFAVHGDEIYEASKSIRTLAETAVLFAGKAAVARPDPVRELAVAARLVKPAKAARKATKKDQLTMF